MTRPMSRIVRLVVAALLVSGVWLTRPSHVVADEVPRTDDTPGVLTLADCYALALTQSERIAIQREAIAEAEGRLQQARSGLRPRVGFSYSYRQQDDTSTDPARRLFVPRENQQSQFTVTQPLFSGFKEFAAMKAAEAEGRARTHETTRAKQLVFLDVADAFYLLLEQRHDVSALATVRSTLTERITELRERERLGRSRRSEVASAEAQLARLEAEVELVRGQETAARQLMEFLTGRTPLGSIAEAEPAMVSLASVDDYLAKADGRPDVQAAQANWLATEQLVRTVRSRAWPTVGLEGNYYTQRPGISEGVHWDAALKFDLPLYQGGQTIGAVEESAARARSARLQLAQTARGAGLEIREAYTKAQAAQARAAALEKALKAAESSYQMQEQEYRRSLVGNLEVLQALRELQDTRRETIRAQHEAKRLYQRLLAAAGDIP